MRHPKKKKTFKNFMSSSIYSKHTYRECSRTSQPGYVSYVLDHDKTNPLKKESAQKS